MFAITAAAAILAGSAIMAAPLPAPAPEPVVGHQSVPKKPNEKRSIDIDFTASSYNPFQAEAGPSTAVTVSFRPIVSETMRTMSHDEFKSATIANNAAYQAQLRAIRQHRADSLIEEAQRFNGDLSGFQRIADMRLEHANHGFTAACTTKVFADLEDINAYHRNQINAANTDFHQAMSSADSHRTDLFELRQARHQANQLQIYSSSDILIAAEEECAGDLFDAYKWTSMDVARLAHRMEGDADDLLD